MVHFPREFLDGTEDEEVIDLSSSSGVDEEKAEEIDLTVNSGIQEGSNINSIQGLNPIRARDSDTEASCQILDGVEDKIDVIGVWSTRGINGSHTTVIQRPFNASDVEFVLPTHNSDGIVDENDIDLWPCEGTHVNFRWNYATIL